MINPMIGQVADARRIAARHMVMNAPAAIPCQVYRKHVFINDPATPTATGLTWNGAALTNQDEPEYYYEPVGFAYLLVDRFVGGMMLDNNTMTESGEVAVLAQIEPYDPDLTNMRERALRVPEWLPAEGDVFELLIAGGLVRWMEVVEINGSSFVGDFGKKYTLNNADIPEMAPFMTELDTRTEP